LAYNLLSAMKLEDYQAILYRQEDGRWVVEIPDVSGCYAWMDTREVALAERSHGFAMIVDEYREKARSLAADTTELVHA
jgi:predicted RNase H-like HicB family nuclease